MKNYAMLSAMLIFAFGSTMRFHDELARLRQQNTQSLPQSLSSKISFGVMN